MGKTPSLTPIYYRNGVREDISYKGMVIESPYVESLMYTVLRRMSKPTDSKTEENEMNSSK